MTVITIARRAALIPTRAIVIGASSGGVAALLELVGGLPRRLNAVVGVVLHVGSQQSILPELLSRRAAWPAVHPQDGHGYGTRSLENAQSDMAEQSLWSSVRTLREREMLSRRLATVAEATGDAAQAEAGRRQADRLRSQVETLTRWVEDDINST